MSMTPALEWWRPEPADDPRPDPCPDPGDSALTSEGALPAARRAPGNLAFRALMVFTFVLLLSPQSFMPALAPLRLAMLSAGIAAAALASERLGRRESVFDPTPENLIAGALALWAALTIPLSWWPAGSLSALIDPFSKSLILFWLLSSVVVTPRRLWFVAWSLLLMSTPLAVTGVWHLVSGVFVPEGITTGFGRIAGYEAPLTANPNDLALTLNLILPMGVALLLSAQRARTRALLLALVALDVVAVIATFSRGGFLTLMTIFLLYVMRLSARSRAVLALPLLLLLCIPLLPSGYLHQMGTITSIESDPTGSAQERWGDLMAAGRSVLDSPLVGAGIGMNALAMNEARGATWRMVHNVYLQYALELGLPGLILFLMLLLKCIRRSGAARQMAARLPGAADLFHLAEAVQIGLFAFAVAAVFHPVGYNFYFYYLAGLALGVHAAATAWIETPIDRNTPIGTPNEVRHEV